MPCTMSKIRILSFAVAGLLLVNVALIAFYFFGAPPPPAGEPRGNPEGPKMIIIEKLHFDKSQQALYENLIREHQQGIRALDDRINAIKNELYATLREDSNPARKDSLLSQIALLQQQVELTHYNHFRAIRELCTPAQLGYYKDLTAELARFFSPPGREGPPPSRK